MDSGKKYNGYTILPNKTIRDDNLSLGARGLLIYMISCPPKWKFTLESLTRETNTRITKIRTYLSELETNGYIKRNISRVDGKIKGFNWDIMKGNNVDEWVIPYDDMPF